MRTTAGPRTAPRRHRREDLGRWSRSIKAAHQRSTPPRDAQALGCINMATVAPSQRLSSTLPCGDSIVTTASSPISVLPCAAIAATAPAVASGTLPTECKHKPCASTHVTPNTPSLSIAVAHTLAIVELISGSPKNEAARTLQESYGVHAASCCYVQRASKRKTAPRVGDSFVFSFVSCVAAAASTSILILGNPGNHVRVSLACASSLVYFSVLPCPPATVGGPGSLDVEVRSWGGRYTIGDEKAPNEGRPWVSAMGDTCVSGVCIRAYM